MQKTGNRFDGEQEKSIDRLPDEILVHILSFLSSTRDCVRSSILGKRWRFLWVRVPNLEFNNRDHQTEKSFSNFLYRFVFIHKGQNIKTFRVQYEDNQMEGSENQLEIDTLVAAAISLNVQVFDIYSNFELLLPQCIFTCKTLVDLRIGCYLENNVPMSGTTVDLPALKKLQLETGNHGSVSLVHLLSGCPALEELEILQEDILVACVFVSSPTLTRLDLKIPFNENYEDNDDVFEVKLDTPALKYLKLHDYLSEDFSTGMLASLTEADVVFGEPRDMENTVLYSRSVLEFVGKLNNVNCLKLTTRWNCMEVPDSEFSAFTIEFCNLTKLEFAGDRRLVTIFLENSVNLEVLTINMDDNLEYWMEPKEVPVGLIYHLGTVSFFDFKCSKPEFNMVEYILRNAKVLKMMKIYVSYCYSDSEVDVLKKKYEALKRISFFERASEACRLVFD